MPAISNSDSTDDRLLYSPRKALDAVLDLGAVPQRLFRVFYPVWCVEVEGRQRVAIDFEELEWFIERGVHEAGLNSVEELARFFGLKERFVRKLVGFLKGIGHLKENDSHLSLTELGLTSVQAKVRYEEHETSAKLYFDGLGNRPLTLEHYAIPVYEKFPEAAPFRAFHIFDHRWDEGALQRLMARRDKSDYNLPDEVTQIRLLSQEPAHLPVYIVERRAGQLEGLPLLLVFSRIRSMRDAVLEEAVNVEPLAQVSLRQTRRQNLEWAVERSLSQRGLDQDDWYLYPDGPWGPQVTVDAQRLKRARVTESEEDRELTVRDIGGYLLAYDYQLGYDWCVWLTCDSAQVRQQAAIERLLEWLQRVTATPTAEDLHRRLAVMRERLRIEPISTDTLMDAATEKGLARALERLDTLVTGDEQA